MRLLDLEIYAWMARYVEGRATLAEFEDWFIPETWHVEQARRSNPAAVELSARIRDDLAALEEGEMAEDVFRIRLKALEAQRADRIRYFQDTISTGTESETTESETTLTPTGG